MILRKCAGNYRFHLLNRADGQRTNPSAVVLHGDIDNAKTAKVKAEIARFEQKRSGLPVRCQLSVVRGHGNIVAEP
jgi:hypothetical protein